MCFPEFHELLWQINQTQGALEPLICSRLVRSTGSNLSSRLVSGVVCPLPPPGGWSGGTEPLNCRVWCSL